MLRHIADKHNVSLSWLVGATNVKNKETFLPALEIVARLDGLPPQALETISNIIEMARSHYKKKPKR
jgi:NADH:ubiquinone oxidoreductase subunit E